MNNSSVDSYLSEGCGRCEHFQTPHCKVHLWTDALRKLRELVLESGLEEEMKWGSPCYTLGGKNVVMLASTRHYCAISFLKGGAIKDEEGLLEKPGPNSRIARMVKFTSAQEVDDRRQHIVGFLKTAIELEKSGTKVELDHAPEPLPEELEERLEADLELKEAFEALTPGRRRSFVIFVSGAKQAATRHSRVEKCIPKIYSGKGYNER